MIFLASIINEGVLQLLLLGIVVIILGTILRYFKQPYIIAYIIAGMLMGKHGFKILTDESTIASIGEIGLILLLFFIGMEISLPKFVKEWKTPTIGTLFQITGSIITTAVVGHIFNWSVSRIIVLGFILSLSSSAIVIKLLEDQKKNNTKIGQDVISILLVQDILIVPMLIASNYLGGVPIRMSEVILQIIGGILIVLGIVAVIKKEGFELPFSKEIEKDHELQVIIAIIVCFGFSVLTSFFGLSAALGAFVGGMVIHATKSTDWFHDSLHSFRILFVAIFFVSIGMMIDVHFLAEHYMVISGLLLSVYICNHFINSLSLYLFNKNWKESLYGGALLAQIGELSFVLCSTAFHTKIITAYEYQLTIIVISLTLLISPFWILGTQKIIKYE